MEVVYTMTKVATEAPTSGSEAHSLYLSACRIIIILASFHNLGLLTHHQRYHCTENTARYLLHHDQWCSSVYGHRTQAAYTARCEVQ